LVGIREEEEGCAGVGGGGKKQYKEPPRMQQIGIGNTRTQTLCK